MFWQPLLLPVAYVDVGVLLCGPGFQKLCVWVFTMPVIRSQNYIKADQDVAYCDILQGRVCDTSVMELPVSPYNQHLRDDAAYCFIL